MTRARKKVVLLLTGIVLALPVLFLVEEHFRGKWALAKYKRELVAKGEKLTIAECRPPIPDPADNGFDEFAYAASMMDSRSLSDLAAPSLRAVAPGKAQVVYHLAEWPIRFRPAGSPPSNSNWQIVEGVLARSRDSMEAARAALLKPRFEDRSVYVVNGQISRVTRAARSAALFFKTDSLVRLHHGQMEESLKDLETLLRLSEAMTELQAPYEQSVRSTVARHAISSTWQALQSPGWNDAQLSRLQRSWEKNDFLGPAVGALEMGRAMHIESFQRMRESNAHATQMAGFYGSYSYKSFASADQLEELSQQIGKHGSQLIFRGLYIPLWQFAWSHEDERNYLEMMQQMLEGARASQSRRSMKPSSDAWKQILSRISDQNFYATLQNPYSEEFVTAFNLTRAASIQAQRDLAITAIALKRYELKHGRLPPDLYALAPEFLTEPPRDIVDGKPLRYRLSEPGFLLYSIGTDEKDDGGNMTGAFPNGADMVWPQPATADELKAADEKERSKRGPRRP